MSIRDCLDNETRRAVILAFLDDMAGLVVDGRSGKINCAGFAVRDNTRAWKGGGARTQAASAMATQAGGCYNIMASVDVCGSTDHAVRAVATLKIFDRSNKPRKVPVVITVVPYEVARLLKAVGLDLANAKVKRAMHLLERGNTPDATKLIDEARTDALEFAETNLHAALRALPRTKR